MAGSDEDRPRRRKRVCGAPRDRVGGGIRVASERVAKFIQKR